LVQREQTATREVLNRQSLLAIQPARLLFAKHEGLPAQEATLGPLNATFVPGSQSLLNNNF
jgi:hypothetical protein